MAGGVVDERNPLPPEFELYRLVKLTGWTVEQIDATDGLLCDWFLNLEQAEIEVHNDQVRQVNG